MCTDLPFAFPIRVPDNMLVALGEFTGLRWNDSLGLEPFICEAIRNYMQPAPAAQERAAPPSESESGYQWKEVFLPEGTRLRAGFDRKQYFAVVAGAQIKYGDHAISPSCFANLYGSGNRNAWKAVWLRLPGSTEWLLADVCRTARKAAIARLMGDEAHGGGRSTPVVPSAPPAPHDVAKQPDKQAAKPPPPRSTPGPTEVRASSMSGAESDHEMKRKKHSSRSARRKRHATQHIPDNPR